MACGDDDVVADGGSGTLSSSTSGDTLGTTGTGGSGTTDPGQGASSTSTSDASTSSPEDGSGDSGEVDPCAPPELPGSCEPIAGEPLPARVRPPEKTVQTIFVEQLFAEFETWCGGCHAGTAAVGNFNVSLSTMSALVTQEAVDRMYSEDPLFLMPPPPLGVPVGEREPGHPMVRLAELLQVWLDAGSPGDSFQIEVLDEAPTEDVYLRCGAISDDLTNIGSCRPDAELYAGEASRTVELDTAFAAMESFEDLPTDLADTDLFTLDSEVLAWQGVVSFAPGYTLWADNAKKQRYVRVPHGESIAFDEGTQAFVLPENTRFYKTFLKPVVDVEGNTAYRKMETRLIVSRKDGVGPDGEAIVRSLFGTYVWNEDETAATLLRDPLRSGEPFSDYVRLYDVHEKEAAELTAQHEMDPDRYPNLLPRLMTAGHVRHYAVPGRDRCVQCHLGAPNADFILGFTPLQLLRRPEGEGGVIEHAYDDELTQLQRFIELGLITGLDPSLAAITKLEDSQSPRAPRNEQELVAQGYMLGNCAHCHNPRGFPTIQSPELTSVLDFYPGPDSGIFEFPLNDPASGEAYASPRITRSPAERRLPIAYISPSLYDTGENEVIPPGTAFLGPQFEQTAFLAPWRSLIYRNVDSPFTYTQDDTIFPHMPMHTPGYDCRSRKIMAEWMLSVPSRLKASCVDEACAGEPQPYEEVYAAEADYEDRVVEAEARVERFRASSRYQMCTPGGGPPEIQSLSLGASPEERDILDAELVAGATTSLEPRTTIEMNDGPTQWAHWVELDTTDPPPPWFPRRFDWQDALVARTAIDPAVDPRGAQIIEILNEVTLSNELIALATTPMPMALWEVKSGCDFTGVPRAGDLDPRPAWMDVGRPPDEDAPVYMESPGGMVFRSVCANCHGQRGDSSGRLASTVAQLTGGVSRVANFRTGLFGPEGSWGDNIDRVFGEAVDGTSPTATDWAARYVAWMALGGTAATIPASILEVINGGLVLGHHRPKIDVHDANMLAIGVAICDSLLVGKRSYTGNVSDSSKLRFDVVGERNPVYADGEANRTFAVPETGDLEMWESLCTFENPLPVRAVGPNDWTAELSTVLEVRGDLAIYHRSAYPADVPVLDRFGQVHVGLDDENLMPWCVEVPSNEQHHEIAQAYVEEHGLVFCPAELVPGSDGVVAGAVLADEERAAWAYRGAANAGFAVFAYLQGRFDGTLPAVPDYNLCEEL